MATNPIEEEAPSRAAALVGALLAAFNARDLDALARLVDARAELLDVPSDEVFVGPDGLRQWWEEWLSAFPDGRVEVVRLSAACDGVVVAELIGRGTHRGPLLGPAGQEFPATGQSVVARFCHVAMVRGERIGWGHLYYDRDGILAQLGIRTGSGGPAGERRSSEVGG